MTSQVYAESLEIQYCLSKGDENLARYNSPTQDDTSVSLDCLGWVGLLLNAESPRSVRFAAAMMQNALQGVSKSTHTRHAGRVERLAGQLRSALAYDQIEDVMHDMHAYLEKHPSML